MIEHKNNSNAPILVIALRIIAVRPAAGPLTLKFDLLKEPMTIPPIIPEIKPAKSGAPEANAIPRQSGNAIRKTTNPEARSDLKDVNTDLVEVINFYFDK